MTEGGTGALDRKATSMSGAFKSGAMGGLLPMPSTLLDVAIGNGISGLISGFMGGFIGVLIDSRQRRRSVRSS